MTGTRWSSVAQIVSVVAAGALVVLGVACSRETRRTVTVYTSVDQELAQPILREYERRSGVTVLAVYDTEATKTAGLATRLIAEKNAPQADVFWNSEVLRTLQLARAGVLEPYLSPAAERIPASFRDPAGTWTGFAARVRVIGINTSLVPEAEWPSSFDELTSPRWRGKVAMAYPLFGTTSLHVAALYAAWGSERAEAWLRALEENEVRIVDGNSTARDLVAAGTVPVCFTDSDDVAVAQRQGRKVAMRVPRLAHGGPLLIPNTAALIARAPHPREARAFLDYLLSEEVEARLADGPGAQIPLRAGIKWPAAIPPFAIDAGEVLDYGLLAQQLDPALEFTRRLFVR